MLLILNRMPSHSVEFFLDDASCIGNLINRSLMWLQKSRKKRKCLLWPQSVENMEVLPWSF